MTMSTPIKGQIVQDVFMAADNVHLCDCPEPCGCYAEGYAAGKDRAYFEVLASLEGPPHAEDCGSQPLFDVN